MQNDTDQFETNPKETHRMAMNKPRANLRKYYHYHNENHRYLLLSTKNITIVEHPHGCV